MTTIDQRAGTPALVMTTAGPLPIVNPPAARLHGALGVFTRNGYTRASIDAIASNR